MMELSPHARALLQVVRRADGPSGADRNRMRTRLAPVLAMGSALATATAPVGAAAGTSGSLAAAPVTAAAGISGALAGAVPVVAVKLSVAQLALWMAMGIGVGTAGIAAVAGLPLSAPSSSVPAEVRQEPSKRSATGVASPAVTEPDTRTHGAEPPSETIGEVRAGAATPEVREHGAEGDPAGADHAGAPVGREALALRASHGSASTLAAETRLLRAVQAARREGRETRALTLLEEHARRFPDGALRTERSVSQALALCAQGQVQASNELRRQILREAPTVPAVSRIRQPCAAVPPPRVRL